MATGWAREASATVGLDVVPSPIPSSQLDCPEPSAYSPLPQQPLLSPLAASLPLGAFGLPQVTSSQSLRLTPKPLFSPSRRP